MTPEQVARTKLWVDNGQAAAELPAIVGDFDRDLMYRHFALLSVERSASDTVVQWDVDRVPDSSINWLFDHLPEFDSPFILKTFKDGWITGTFRNGIAAVERIEALMRLRGVSMANRFVSRELPVRNWNSKWPGIVDRPEFASDRIVYSELVADDHIPMRYVGTDSLVAKILGKDWGADENYLLDNNLQKIERDMIRSYLKAYSTGQTTIEDVFAQVPSPKDGEPFWLPYRRLIWPTVHKGKDCLASISLYGQPDVRLSPLAEQFCGSYVPVERAL